MKKFIVMVTAIACIMMFAGCDKSDKHMDSNDEIVENVIYGTIIYEDIIYEDIIYEDVTDYWD